MKPLPPSSTKVRHFRHCFAGATHILDAVAQSVDKALATIQPEPTPLQPAPATPSSQDAVYALEIEAFCCCLRSQRSNLAAVKRFIQAVSTTGPLIELWTGYSTILCIIGKLLRKVCLLVFAATTAQHFFQITKYSRSVQKASIMTRSSSAESLFNYCCIGRYSFTLLSLISRFDPASPLLSFSLTVEEINAVAHIAPLNIFYGAKFGFMYPFKLRTLLKNIIIASASVGAAFDPSSSFKTMMLAAFKAPLLLVSSSHRAEGSLRELVSEYYKLCSCLRRCLLIAT